MSEGNVAADQLRLFIERIERLEEEKRGIADDVKDVYGEAKANGYDVKTMRAIVRLRKMDANARREADALLETYREALGLDCDYSRRPLRAVDPDKTPLEKTVEAAKAADGELDEAARAKMLESDNKLDEARALVLKEKRPSASWLQQMLKIGFNEACRYIEQLEAEGLVSPPDAMGRRRMADELADETAPARAAG